MAAFLGQEVDEEKQPVSIADATNRLLAADSERQRKRRSAPATPNGSTDPSTPISSSSEAGFEDYKMPLRSDFFDLCCRYFIEPQMKVRV